MNLNVQFKKGVLELCVLILIRKNDEYGYELAQSVSKYIEVAEGALYLLLRKLVKEMIVEWEKFVRSVSILIEEEFTSE
ncbi:PadR family transcriptional regulator [Bacillus cereus group sp. BfR-BA-01380]|uniref:PadR family transcriptional regulator n=1 Tax=Bacillus cereus group sp. BfR-BA-01380 TaxID=2920324 RepID=UPI001F58A891|nr:PadR family transcriptional regulator [Bacillus cereus group sp. BfR-BA-01380]